MKVTFEEAKEVAGRLPVGYYLGRKVPVIIDEDLMGAKVDLVKCEIHIGLKLLNEAAGHVGPAAESKWSREKLLRCLLYHEVGHVIMTPPSLKERVCIRNRKTMRVLPWSSDVVNIFEDERLECVLSHFFMGVDFRGFVKMIHEGCPKGDTPAYQFFDAVRLRVAKPHILKAIDEAVAKTASVNCRCEGMWHYAELNYYETVLQDLYTMIVEDADGKGGKSGDGSGGGKSEGKPKDGGDGSTRPPSDCGGSKSDGESESDSTKSDGGSESDGGKDGEPKCPGSGGESDEGKSEGESKSGGSGDDGESEGESGGSGDGGKPGPVSHYGSPTGGDDESDDDEPASAAMHGTLPSDMLTKLADEVFFTPTSEVSSALNRFAVRISKKKGKQAAGRWSGIHGKLEPKRDALGKERIFRRPSDIGESLSSAVNLVLWVDVSGSFSSSADKLNTILAAAASAEKMSLGKLRVQVVKIGDDATVAGADEWQVQCDQCNAITMTYYDAWVDTRDRARRNIDIVVLDGYAKSDEVNESEKMPDGTPIEKKIWDSYDCHIICDKSNEKIFKKMAKAHISYIRGAYAEALEREVVKTLDRIL